MDGTRGRAPGRNAENWSRSDKIRAGAVSGPWRSTPRKALTPEPDAAAARASASPADDSATRPQAGAMPQRPESREAAARPADAPRFPAEGQRRASVTETPRLAPRAVSLRPGPVPARADPAPGTADDIPAKPGEGAPRRISPSPRSAPARAAAGPRRSSLRLPVALGGLAALGLVAMALVFRPEPEPIPAAVETAALSVAAAPDASGASGTPGAQIAAPAPPRDAVPAARRDAASEAVRLADAGPVEAVSAPEEAPVDLSVLPEAPVPEAALPRAERPRARLAPPQVSPADIAAAQVMIRVGPDMGATRRAEIASVLAAAGFTAVKVQQVGFEVARPRLGYFRAADRGLAEVLASLIEPLVGQVAVRDYDELLAEPAAGRLDLWLGG